MGKHEGLHTRACDVHSYSHNILNTNLIAFHIKYLGCLPRKLFTKQLESRGSCDSTHLHHHMMYPSLLIDPNFGHSHKYNGLPYQSFSHIHVRVFPFTRWRLKNWENTTRKSEIRYIYQTKRSSWPNWQPTIFEMSRPQFSTWISFHLTTSPLPLSTLIRLDKKEKHDVPYSEYFNTLQQTLVSATHKAKWKGKKKKKTIS